MYHYEFTLLQTTLICDKCELVMYLFSFLTYCIQIKLTFINVCSIPRLAVFTST